MTNQLSVRKCSVQPRVRSRLVGSLIAALLLPAVATAQTRLPPVQLPQTAKTTVTGRPQTNTPTGIGSSVEAYLQVLQGQAKTRAHPAAQVLPASQRVNQPTVSTVAGQTGGSLHVDPAASSLPIPYINSNVSYARYLDPYRGRAYELAESANQVASGAMDLQMWWDDSLHGSLGFAPHTIPVDIATLTQVALVSSPYVKSVLTEPQIRHSDIVIADAEFDSKLFLEGKFADSNDPVGNTLTTGDNSNRFRDQAYSSSGGLRKKTRRGGQLEITQRGGFQQNNSIFLDPNPQGTTKLEINFTQPLLRDGGKAVNHVRILLAQLDFQVANAQVRADLEDHLIEVTQAYWDLYQARSEWLQRNRLSQGAEHLYQVLQARNNVDSQQRQILRALAAVKSRKSDVVRAATRIRNSQSKLRLLTGSQQLINATQFELTPQDRPLASAVNVSTRDSIITALDNRPDIAESLQRIHAVSARVGAARNQVLPRLDMILGTYVAGLDSNRDTLGAWSKQFSDGGASYAVGLAYEFPVGNRANQARLNRARWEMQRAMFDFQQATEVTFTEVEIAVRETETAFTEMVTKKQSVQAAANEVVYLQDRWDLLPDPNESAILLIEDLLDAQERLADEERDLVSAQVAYAISWVQLRKSMGILLRFDSQPTTQATGVGKTAADIPAQNLGPAGKAAPVVGGDPLGASLEAPQQ